MLSALSLYIRQKQHDISQKAKTSVFGRSSNLTAAGISLHYHVEAYLQCDNNGRDCIQLHGRSVNKEGGWWPPVISNSCCNWMCRRVCTRTMVLHLRLVPLRFPVDACDVSTMKWGATLNTDISGAVHCGLRPRATFWWNACEVIGDEAAIACDSVWIV